MATTLTQAVPQDAHRVRVTITGTPLAQSSFAQGDALNPATWSILDQATLATIPVLTVNAVALGTNSLFTLDLIIASVFAADPYVVSCSSLWDLSAASTIQAALASQPFTGITLSVPQTPQAAYQSTPVDLQNAVQGNTQTGIGGTLAIASGGDYVTQSGESLLQKLVLRRLTTTQGAFFHLPNYGAGINEKTNIKPSMLSAIYKNVIQQVSLEPELTNVTASVSWSPSTNTLTVIVGATLTRTGAPFSMTANLPAGGS